MRLTPLSVIAHVLWVVVVPAALAALWHLAENAGGRRALRAVASGFNGLANRPDWAITTVAVFTFLLHATLGLTIAIVPPFIHDEFSYLLAADTFAHGRLTNPPLPDGVWQPLESFHIIHTPTYQSKYPPAQGLVLALGQVMAGVPIVGAWLSTAAAVAAVCWMLYAFVPRRWALLAGILTALHPLMMQWAQSYWGGAVAMAGGALLCGAYRRLIDQGRAAGSTGAGTLAIIMGVGLAILANSRPFEGFILAAPIGVGLLIWFFRATALPRGRKAIQVGIPLLVLMALNLAAMGYYNWRVTGHVSQMPYTLHEKQYAIAPPFMWMPPQLPPPVYRHRTMEDWFVDYQYAIYQRQLSVAGFVKELFQEKLYMLGQGFFRPWPLAIGLLALPWLLRRPWLRWAALILLWMLLALLSELLVWPHYAAPAAGLLFLVLIAGLRHLRTWRSGDVRYGRWIFRFIVLALLVAAGRWIVEDLAGGRNGPAYRRAEFLIGLEDAPGKQLVFVRYSADHNVHSEWVYNQADINNAPVVWARDMGPEGNRALIRHFPTHERWMMEVSEVDIRLGAYPYPYP